MKIDWPTLAKEKGFETPNLMLHYWYTLQNKSAQTIAIKLGISSTAVFSKLKELGIATRHKNHNTGPWKRQARAIFKNK